ncbi:MAG: SDR family oxidoreductase [Pseudomonadota bacterium]
MKVLIIGATGDVGSEAAKRAVVQGHQVSALVRPTSNKSRFDAAAEKIKFFEGDILDMPSLVKALEGMDGVIVSIRLTPGEMRKGRSYKDVEECGVKNITDAARQQGVHKIIHISAAGVGPECISDMYQAKHCAEEAIRTSGLDYTIFKPSGMFKDFDFFHIPNVLKMGEAHKWPFGPVDFHMNPLSHLDLAACMVRALDNPRAARMTMEIGGPDCITQGDLLNMIARVAGIKTTYTEGVSKEQLVAMIKSSPQKGFFTAEQIQDFVIDKSIDHAQVRDIFGIDFERIEDYLKKAVPRAKAALAQQGT